MKQQSTSKSSRASRKLKQVLDTEEVPPANTASKKPSKRCKASNDTSTLSNGPERENTSGLAIFPDELLLEILSYYPDSEPELNEDTGRDADAHFARRERLIALSQTCRNLRRFLRPYVWRRIEVFVGMRVSAATLGTKRQLALELIRQLEIVTIRDPSLAEYVNVVNVMIADYSVKSVIQELTRCLALFPNMHTFKLNHAKLTAPLKQCITHAFSTQAFPQIRSVAVPEGCTSLLKHFPLARHVYLVGATYIQSDYKASILAAHCPLTENISLFIPSRVNLPLLVELFPNATDITLEFAGELHKFTKPHMDFILSNFPSLKVVRIKDRPIPMTVRHYKKIHWRVGKALLRLQERDHKEKSIILLDSQDKKIITLPWPPIRRSQLHATIFKM